MRESMGAESDEGLSGWVSWYEKHRSEIRANPNSERIRIPFPLWEYETIALHYLKGGGEGSLDELIEGLCQIPIRLLDDVGEERSLWPAYLAKRLGLKNSTVLLFADEMRGLGIAEWDGDGKRHVLIMPSKTERERSWHANRSDAHRFVEDRVAAGDGFADIQRQLLQSIRDKQ